MGTFELLFIPQKILESLPLGWTLVLYLARYSMLLMFLPGIGMGERGMLIRGSAVVVLAMTGVAASPEAALPADWGTLAAQLSGEALLGMLIGLLAQMIIAGVQTAAHLASTSMGLGMSQLIDPALGIQVSDLSRILGDIAVLVFLALGGHYVAIYAAAGLGGSIAPGTFTVTESVVRLLVQHSADIFEAGVMISAPIIVALLLTQFAMGLLSRAVPTVNIFIVSFPVTIGIGLIVASLMLPELITVVTRQVKEYDGVISGLPQLLQ